MKKILIVITAFVISGCEKCTTCTETITIKRWNINSNTESTRDSVTVFEVCDVNGVNVVDGLTVEYDIQEVENNIYEQLTTEIICD
jgi:hypothetical protein